MLIHQKAQDIARRRGRDGVMLGLVLVYGGGKQIEQVGQHVRSLFARRRVAGLIQNGFDQAKGAFAIGLGSNGAHARRGAKLIVAAAYLGQVVDYGCHDSYSLCEKTCLIKTVCDRNTTSAMMRYLLPPTLKTT